MLASGTWTTRPAAQYMVMVSLAPCSLCGFLQAPLVSPLSFLLVLVRCHQLLCFSLVNFSLLLVHNLLCGVTPAPASSPSGPHAGLPSPLYLDYFCVSLFFPYFDFKRQGRARMECGCPLAPLETRLRTEQDRTKPTLTPTQWTPFPLKKLNLFMHLSVLLLLHFPTCTKEFIRQSVRPSLGC